MSEPQPELTITECKHPQGRWTWYILDMGSWFMGSPLDFDSPEAARAHFLQAAQELAELANRVTNSGSDS